MVDKHLHPFHAGTHIFYSMLRKVHELCCTLSATCDFMQVTFSQKKTICASRPELWLIVLIKHINDIEMGTIMQN